MVQTRTGSLSKLCQKWLPVKVRHLVNLGGNLYRVELKISSLCHSSFTKHDKTRYVSMGVSFQINELPSPPGPNFGKREIYQEILQTSSSSHISILIRTFLYFRFYKVCGKKGKQLTTLKNRLPDNRKPSQPQYISFIPFKGMDLHQLKTVDCVRNKVKTGFAVLIHCHTPYLNSSLMKQREGFDRICVMCVNRP